MKKILKRAVTVGFGLLAIASLLFFANLVLQNPVIGHEGHDKSDHDEHQEEDHDKKEHKHDKDEQDHSKHNHKQAEGEAINKGKEEEDHEHSSLKLTKEMKKNVGLVLGSVEEKDYIKYLEVPATIRTNQELEQSFVMPAKGVLSEINISEGSYVTNGQVLASVSRNALIQPDIEGFKEYFVNKNIDYSIRAFLTNDQDAIRYLTPYFQTLKMNLEKLEKIKVQGILALRQYFYTQIAKELGLLSEKQQDWFKQILKIEGDLYPEMIPLFVFLADKQLLSQERIQQIVTYAKQPKEVFAYLYFAYEGKSSSQLALLSAQGFLGEEIVLRAPVNGFVKDVKSVKGDLLSDDDILFKFISIDNFICETQLIGKEQTLTSYAIEEELAFCVRKKNQKEYVQATFKGLTIDESKRTTYSFSLLNKRLSGKLDYLPGETVILMIPEKVFKGAITLPTEALIEEGFKKFIFIEEEENSFERVEVAVKYKDKQIVIIEENEHISEEEKIVFKGASGLDMIMKSADKPAGDGHNHAH